MKPATDYVVSNARRQLLTNGLRVTYAFNTPNMHNVVILWLVVLCIFVIVENMHAW